jgi:hypothetical protein
VTNFIKLSLPSNHKGQTRVTFLLSPNIFWLNVPAAELITVQYSTWFPYSTGHAEVLLLRFSLL